MERCFIATNDSKYVKDCMKYNGLLWQQMEFIKSFFLEKGIESVYYDLGGDGLCGVPFEEYEKSNITLSIDPTENDRNKFGKILTKPNKHGLCSFKKNSNILKEFAQKCVEEKVIVNLWKPRVGDCFNQLGYRGYSMAQFGHNDTIYIRIESDFLEKDEIPEGFIEIKLSEYYKAKEEMESNK